MSKEGKGGGSEEKAYDVLLKCRELDINHFVSRSNVCVVVQGAIIALVAKPMLAQSGTLTWADRLLGVTVALAGLAFSVLCIRVVKGASFWVSYWESRLAEIESRVLPDVKIFRDHPSGGNREKLEELAGPPWRLSYVSSRKALLGMFYLFFAVWLLLLIFVAVR